MKRNVEKVDDGNNTFKIKRIYVIFVLISTFFINFDSAVVIPIIANYAVSLGASLLFSAIIVGIYSIFHIPSNVFFGRLIDKFGRKGFLTFGICLDGLSIFMYFLATNPVFLLLARIVHGLGGGFGGPATMSYLGDSFSEGKSGKGMAFYGMSVGFSMLFGFVIGGFLSSLIGIKNLFLIISILMFTISLFSLYLPKIYITKPKKLKLKEEIRIFFRLITYNKLIVPYMVIIVVFFNLGIITSSYTIFLKEYGYEDSQIGMILGIMVIFSISINYPAGKLSDRIGKVRFLIIGLFFCSIAFLILYVSPMIPFPYLGMILFGLGHGFVFPTSAGIVKDESTLDNRGIASGVFYALTVAGIAIGSPISGILIELYTFKIALLLGIVLPLVFCIFLIIIGSQDSHPYES